jgi:hypothetical protein
MTVSNSLKATALIEDIRALRIITDVACSTFEKTAYKTHEFALRLEKMNEEERRQNLPQFEQLLFVSAGAKEQTDALKEQVVAKIFEYSVSEKGNLKVLASTLFSTKKEQAEFLGKLSLLKWAIAQKLFTKFEQET